MTGQEARDDTRYCQRGDVMRREQKPGVTTWQCPRERTCGRFEMRSEPEPSQEARDDEREALERVLFDGLHRGLTVHEITATVIAAGYRKHPEPEITGSASQRVTEVLGTEDWVIVRSGDGLVTDVELDELEGQL